MLKVRIALMILAIGYIIFTYIESTIKVKLAKRTVLKKLQISDQSMVFWMTFLDVTIAFSVTFFILMRADLLKYAL